VRAERQGVEGASLRALGRAFATVEGYERAQRLARRLQRPAVREGRVRWFVGPLAGWGASRELPAVAAETFREWWQAHREER
jgi:L-lactate dehydrogenase complex protein LldF